MKDCISQVKFFWYQRVLSVDSVRYLRGVYLNKH